MSLELDYWDDEAVGAFEPEKVLGRLRLEFPDAEIDQTDHQRTRLLTELEYWAQHIEDAKRRDGLIRSSWNLYQTNGPTYRFIIPFPTGQCVIGTAPRFTVEFHVPAGLPAEYRERLVTFLRSLRMGTPTLEVEGRVDGSVSGDPP